MLAIPIAWKGTRVINQHGEARVQTEANDLIRSPNPDYRKIRNGLFQAFMGTGGFEPPTSRV